LNFDNVEKALISEIKLLPIEAKIFLLVVIEGKMNVEKIAQKIGISSEDALQHARKLIELGGFIDMPKTEYEAMHPRFTAVNMYRKMCQRENIEFKMNIIVDNIGIALEKPYDDARTK